MERPLILIPAHNEALGLSFLISELKEQCAHCDVLVIDDASDDGTERVLSDLGVHAIRLEKRLGVGGAVKHGLRYAAQAGYQIVVRLDADGQHLPENVATLLSAMQETHADAVVGCRYLHHNGYRTPHLRRLGQRAIAFALAPLLEQPVTDPTSGFWAFGPRALHLLAREHPPGYSEPLLRLLLHQRSLRVIEVSVPMRQRVAGNTKLTFVPATMALARIMVDIAKRGWFVSRTNPNDYDPNDYEQNPKDPTYRTLAPTLCAPDYPAAHTLDSGTQ